MAVPRAADLIAELVRYLNYATGDARGLPGPDTVADVIGNLRAAFQGLNQTLRQMNNALGDMAGDSRTEVANRGEPDERWPFYDVAGTVREAQALLANVRIAMLSAEQRAARAQVYANRLLIVTPDDVELQEKP